MATDGNNKRPIIIKKVEEGHHGHHGGAWKVAYADFVTAMMAFFLLLWLLGSTTEEQRKGIADYFNPSIAVSTSPSGAGGMLGGVTIAVPGAMSSSGAPVTAEGVPSGRTQEIGGNEEAEDSGDAAKAGAQGNATGTATGGETAQEAENRRFAEAEKALREALREFPELSDIAGSVVVDRTPEGLRIQLVDQANYSLFPSGAAAVAGRTQELLALVTRAVSGLPNKVSIRGHTDARPFAAGSGRDNWTLSAERANATRLAMVASGLQPNRVANVVGLADVDPFVKGDPMAPQNRRMSIILLAEQKG